MASGFNFVKKMKSSKSYFNGLSGGRKSMRLKNHDYGSMGYYFITMCCQNRLRWMGEVVDGKMKLNEIGKMIFEEWLSTEQKRGNVKLHEFVIMPDHFHGLIEISHSVKKAINHEKFYSPKNTIGSIVRGFKSSTTTQLYNYISSHELHWRRGELIFAPNTKGREIVPNTTGMEFVPNAIGKEFASNELDMKSALHDSEMNSVLNNSGHESTSDELEKTCAPFKLWQRGYYDRFIRTHDDLNAIKNYIKANPSRWTSRMNENSL